MRLAPFCPKMFATRPLPVSSATELLITMCWVLATEVTAAPDTFHAENPDSWVQSRCSLWFEFLYPYPAVTLD